MEGNLLRQLLFSLVLCTGGLTVGNNIGLNHIAYNSAEEVSDYVFCNKGVIPSIIFLGSAMATILLPYCASKWGKKIILITTSSCQAGLWFVLGYTGDHLWLFYIVRFLLGFTIGIYPVIIPIYVSEICVSRIRGAMVILYYVLFFAGSYLMHLMSRFFKNRLPMTYTSSVLSLIYTILLIFVRESPYYLIEKGYPVEVVVDTIRVFRGNDYDSIGGFERIDQVMNDAADRKKITYWNRFKQSNCWQMFGICNLLIVCHNLIGSLIFNEYNETSAFLVWLIQSVKPYKYNVILDTTSLFFVIFALLICDYLGRLRLLRISCLGAGTCFFFLGCYHLIQRVTSLNTDSINNWLIIVLGVVLCASFAIGLGPIPFLLITELYAHDLKIYLSAFNFFIYWLTLFLFNFKQQLFIDSLHTWYLSFIISLFAYFNAFVIFYKLFETKHKHFVRIQAELNARVEN